MCFWITLPFLSFLFCLKPLFFFWYTNKYKHSHFSSVNLTFCSPIPFVCAFPRHSHKQKAAHGLYLEKTCPSLHNWAWMQSQAAAVKPNLFVMNNSSGAHQASDYDWWRDCWGQWQRVQLQNTGQLSRWLVEAQAQPYSYECAWGSEQGRVEHRGVWWWQLRQLQLCLVTVSRAAGKVTERLQSLQQVAPPGLSNTLGARTASPSCAGRVGNQCSQLSQKCCCGWLGHCHAFIQPFSLLR